MKAEDPPVQTVSIHLLIRFENSCSVEASFHVVSPDMSDGQLGTSLCPDHAAAITSTSSVPAGHAATAIAPDVPTQLGIGK